MTLSAIYLLDMKGKVLVSRNYRGDIENNLIDKFIGLLTDKVLVQLTSVNLKSSFDRVLRGLKSLNIDFSRKCCTNYFIRS